MENLLPSILSHEGISRLADGGLYITDRRRLPFEDVEVFCPDAWAASDAIRSMVTQGGGPLEVALNALLLTYRTDRDHLEEAAAALMTARPTNTTMRREISSIMEAYSSGEDMEELIDEAFCRYDGLYDRISDIGAGLIKDGDGILTTCFPEHTFMLSVKKAAMEGRRVSVFVPETRPYLQGAHLTEPCLREMGIECYLITDGMGAHFMDEGRIGIYMTAADLVLPDRTVVNKTGTLSNAIAAARYGIPYYAFSVGIDEGRSRDDIVIEYRDGESLRSIGGVRTADEHAEALYPCFDIIESDLVAGIVTEGGIL